MKTPTQEKAPDVEATTVERIDSTGEGEVKMKVPPTTPAHPESEPTQEATTERLWVSLASTAGRFDELAAHWRVWVNVSGAGTASVFDLTGPAGMSLADIDLALVERGLFRSAPWEMGSDYGWVAWVTAPKSEVSL